MMRGMFAAISGLKNHQVMLDVTANDIANVNTIGYKSARTTFKDSLTQLQRGASGPGGANGGANAAQVGLGVGLGSIDNLMPGGALQSTGNALDVAIQGDGLLPRARPARRRRRPRAPTSSTPAPATSPPTRDGYLLTQDGYYVMGQTPPAPAHRHAAPASRPARPNVAIGQDGAVTYVDGRRRRPRDRRASSRWPRSRTRPASSARLGNRWLESANSGAAHDRHAPARQCGFTTAGAVEMSNVDLAQTFTSMITAQRGFQANSRVISTSDEMLQDLVNLKR